MRTPTQTQGINNVEYQVKPEPNNNNNNNNTLASLIKGKQDGSSNANPIGTPQFGNLVNSNMKMFLANKIKQSTNVGPTIITKINMPNGDQIEGQTVNGKIT